MRSLFQVTFLFNVHVVPLIISVYSVRFTKLCSKHEHIPNSNIRENFQILQIIILRHQQNCAFQCVYTVLRYNVVSKSRIFIY
jgi:hypothetical protein